MTNTPPIAAPLCCPTGGGGDLLPLLVVIAVLLAGNLAIQAFKKRNGISKMKNLKHVILVASVVVAAGIVFVLKQAQKGPAKPYPAAAKEFIAAEAGSPQSAVLPRLVELGADKCIPCKMMAPILEELNTAYAGQFEVEFIDVWKNPGAGESFAIRSIPTQIFYDAQGQELFRHEGFYPKEDILAKWKELGVALAAPATPPTP